MSPTRVSYRAAEPVGLDAPQQARRGERPQDVVDGLVGHRAEIGPDETDDRVRVEVRVVVHRRQHRETGTRHAQTGLAHLALEVGGRGHGRQCGPVSGINQDFVAIGRCRTAGPGGRAQEAGRDPVGLDGTAGARCPREPAATVEKS